MLQLLRLCFCTLLSFTLLSCGIQSRSFEPNLPAHPPIKKELQTRPSPFEDTGKVGDWQQERFLAAAFAKDEDFYRAITSYRRALFLLPETEKERRLEILYSIMQCYYLAEHFEETIDSFEKTELSQVNSHFPPFYDLLLVLHDSYRRLGREEKAAKIVKILEQASPARADDVKLSQALFQGDFAVIEALSQEGSKHPHLLASLEQYSVQKKSPRKARIYNALLPGAGYAYVGLKQSAFTSFMLNSLFTAAAIHFFDKGQTAAGLITTSFEMGWYFGGINGAGLAAEEYNERLYASHAESMIQQERLYPFLMMEYSF